MIELPRTFHIRKYHRNVSFAGLVFFGLMIVVSLLLASYSARPDRSLVTAICLVGFWSFFVSLSLYALAAYKWTRLRITDDEIALKGLIRSRTVSLSKVQEVIWNYGYRGAIWLRDANGSVRIDLDNFEVDERICMIRFVREQTPAQRQANWDLFCHKVALPFVRYLDCDGKPRPEPGQVLISRRRWDWYFLPLIMLCAVAGTVAAWRLAQPRLLVAPLAPTSIWAVLRVLTPKRGYLSSSISATPGMSAYLLFLLLWLAIAVAGISLFPIIAPHIPAKEVWAGSLLAGWFAVLLWRAYREDVTRLERDKVESLASVEAWNRLSST